MSIESALYAGQVWHRRIRPREHVLRYRVFTLLLDLQEIDSLASRLWLFSHNRWNLVSFHDRDFLDADTGNRSAGGRSLADGIRQRLRDAGQTRTAARIFVSCYPRVLGYAFNPLTVFYCLDASGDVFAIVHEVHNTFGEKHAYVLPVRAGDGRNGHWIRQQTDKALFVSPFAHMAMHYEFRLNPPGARQIIAIRVFDDAGQWLSASYTARREPLTAGRLLRQVLARPGVTLKVTIGIHWEALLLWLKRVPWYRHVRRPAQPQTPVGQPTVEPTGCPVAMDREPPATGR